MKLIKRVDFAQTVYSVRTLFSIYSRADKDKNRYSFIQTLRNIRGVCRCDPREPSINKFISRIRCRVYFRSKNDRVLRTIVPTFILALSWRANACPLQTTFASKCANVNEIKSVAEKPLLRIQYRTRILTATIKPIN